MTKKTSIPEWLIILLGVIATLMGFPVGALLLAKWVQFVVGFLG